MTKDEKDFAFKKAQAYKDDALYWNNKANDHYKSTSNLLTTISITALGFITLFFPENVNFSNLEKILFLVIIISSVISIIAALWQGYIDQDYFVYLSSDSSRRQSIWENDNTSESTKQEKIKELEKTDPKSKTFGLNIQVCCFIILIICMLFLGMSRLLFKTDNNRSIYSKYSDTHKSPSLRSYRY